VGSNNEPKQPFPRKESNQKSRLKSRCLRDTLGASRSNALPFSAKTTYALLALLELAGEDGNSVPLQISEIATRQAIPERYLEQMMRGMRQGGLLRSTRGARGGYQLARPASAISLAEVISCLEAPGSPSQHNKESAERSVVNDLAQRLEQQRLELLKNTSLAHLLQERDSLLQAQTMYFI